jgi:uncharacterized membrane protein YgcG
VNSKLAELRHASCMAWLADSVAPLRSPWLLAGDRGAGAWMDHTRASTPYVLKKPTYFARTLHACVRADAKRTTSIHMLDANSGGGSSGGGVRKRRRTNFHFLKKTYNFSYEKR